MKIEITDKENKKVSIEYDHDEMQAVEILRGFMGLMVCYGFHQDTVTNALLEISEDYESID